MTNTIQKKRVYEIAIELMAERAKLLKEYSMRYESNPPMWKELKTKHEKYVEYLEAIEYLQKNMEGL